MDVVSSTISLICVVARIFESFSDSSGSKKQHADLKSELLILKKLLEDIRPELNTAAETGSLAHAVQNCDAVLKDFSEGIDRFRADKNIASTSSASLHFKRRLKQGMHTTFVVFWWQFKQKQIKTFRHRVHGARSSLEIAYSDHCQKPCEPLSIYRRLAKAYKARGWLLKAGSRGRFRARQCSCAVH
jgi:hypothetical protein